MLSKRIPAGARVLDLGCGNGFVSGAVAEAGYAVTGVDASEDGLRLARNAHPHARFVRASVYDEDLPQVVGPVDAVVALEVVEHLYFPAMLFTAAFQVLSPGGILITSAPYHGYLKNLLIGMMGAWDRHWGPAWDGGHIKFFSKRTLSSMIEDRGFTIQQIAGVGRVPWLWKSMVVVAQRRRS